MLSSVNYEALKITNTTSSSVSLFISAAFYLIVCVLSTIYLNRPRSELSSEYIEYRRAVIEDGQPEGDRLLDNPDDDE